MAGRFSVEAVFKAIDRITGPVRGMQRSVSRFATRVESRLRGVRRMADAVGSGLKKIGAAAVLAGAVAVPAFADIVRTGAEFEHSVVSAAAKFPGAIRKGTEAFDELAASAREVGRTTEFTASQAAQGLDFLAMAGFNAEQSMAALPGLVGLATASNLDLARASDIASDTLGAFNLTTKDAAQLSLNLGRVNDVLAKTVTTANTNMEDLFSTIRFAGPVAASAGSDIETLAAAAGTLANSGIKGTNAGTALRAIFTRLQAPPTMARKALEQLNVSTVDAEGNFRGFVSVLRDLEKQLPAVGKAGRAQALSDIFGVEALSAANVLFAAGADNVEKYAKQLRNSEGAAREMAETIRGSTLNNMKALGSAVESVKISIFSMTEGPLNKLIKRLTEWVRQNEELIAQGVSEWIVKIIEDLPRVVEWIGKIGKGLAIFAGVTVAVNALQAAIALLNIVMAANPIVLMVAGAVILAGAITALIVKSDELVKKFEEMPIALRAILIPIELILRGLQMIKKAHNFLTDKAAGAVETIFPKIGLPVPQRSTLFSGAEDADRPQSEGPTITERLFSSFKEIVQRQESEVTIRDETGRAEVTRGGGEGLKIERTGEL